ncbi:hypothetical protein SAMN05216588_105283 [Pseudomonas flavescens]|uniref:Uncharacterized protein n=2 Tax=Phytopseudomonas flavescens TaxID=29435 RepID=A0A1G8DJJ2_9GAMM|nr:hypothetical protein SAMN05216588_105283 [Pseudomonas flavescens]
MLIEGELIEARAQHAVETGQPDQAFEGFNEMAQRLGLTSVLADDVDRIHTQFTSDIDRVLKESSENPDSGPSHLTNSMRAAVQNQADLFAKRDAVYEEVLNEDLTKAEREHVLASQLSFSFYATEVGSRIPETLDRTLSHATNVVEGLQAKKAEYAQLFGAGATQTAALDAQITEWSTAAEQLQKMKTDLLPDFNKAMDLNKLVQHINALNESSGSLRNQLHAFMGQGLRQMVLSGFALGAANAFTEAALTKWPGAQPIVGGLVTGLAHDFGTHFLARGVLDIVGGATRAVTPGEVTTAPNKYVSVNGVPRERSPDEINQKRAENDEMVRQLKQTQNAHKLGVASAEAQFWGMFFGAQGGRGTLFNSTGAETGGTPLDSTAADHPGGATMSSMVAGFGMGAKGGMAGMRASVTDGQNRSIPAYTMAPAPKPKENSAAATTAPSSSEEKTGWVQTKEWLQKGAKEMDYRKPGPRQTIENKAGSLASGLALGKVMGPARDAVANSQPALKIPIEGLATGGRSPLLLALFWGGAQLGSIVKADQAREKAAEAARAEAAGEEPNYQPSSFGGLKSAWKTVMQPNRDENPHRFDPNTVGRAVENTYDVLQAAGQIPHTTISGAVEWAGGKAASALKREKPSGDPSDNV